MSVSIKIENNIDRSAELSAKLNNAQVSLNTPYQTQSLWSHQRDSLEAIRNAFSSGKTFGYVKHACATGKTRQIATVLSNSKLRALITAPSKDLAHQLVSDINSDFPEIGAVYGIRSANNTARVNIITENKLLSAWLNNHEELENLLKNKELVILDEAHHYLGRTRSQLLNYVKTKCLVLGFTATDTYYSNKKLTKPLGEPLHTFSIQEASTIGLIAPHRHLIANTNIDLSTVKVVGSDYDLNGMSKALLRSDYVRDIVDYCCSNLAGQQVIVSVNALKQAETWVEYFSEKGYSAKILHGKLDMTDRNKVLADFKEGRLDVLVGRKLVDTGVNCPSASVLIAEPTVSRLRAEQRFGRIARLDPNNSEKVATIIDIYPQYFNPANMPVFFSDVLDNASNVLRATRKAKSGKSANSIYSRKEQKIISEPNLVEALLEERSKQAGVYLFARGKFVSHSEQAEFRKLKKKIIANTISTILSSPNYQDYLSEILVEPRAFGLIMPKEKREEIKGALKIIKSLTYHQTYQQSRKTIEDIATQLPAIQEAKKFIAKSFHETPMITSFIFSEALIKLLTQANDVDLVSKITKQREKHEKLRNHLIERFLPLVDILIEEINDKKNEYEIRDLSYTTIFNFFNGTSKLSSYRYYDSALVYLLKLQIKNFYSELANKDRLGQEKESKAHQIYTYDLNKEEKANHFQELLKVARRILPSRSYKALELRYLGPALMTYEDIGRVLGVGKERVRQIIALSIRKLAQESSQWNN